MTNLNLKLPFEIYIDLSDYWWIVQKKRQKAFFNRKLSSIDHRYIINQKELLSIIETLNEFKWILVGQQIKVYTYHKNLVQDALGSVYRLTLKVLEIQNFGLNCNLCDVRLWENVFERYWNLLCLVVMQN